MHFSLRKNKLVADKQLRSSAYLYLNTTGWTAPGSPNWLEWWCTTEENGLPGEQRRAVSIPNCRAHCVDCETLNHTTCIRTNKAEWQAGFLAVCVCVCRKVLRTLLLAEPHKKACTKLLIGAVTCIFVTGCTQLSSCKWPVHHRFFFEFVVVAFGEDVWFCAGAGACAGQNEVQGFPWRPATRGTNFWPVGRALSDLRE